MAASVALLALAGYWLTKDLSVDGKLQVARDVGSASTVDVQVSANRGVKPPAITPTKAVLRHALVIGNSNYRKLPKLDNPRNDADRIAAALGERGFRVTKKLDLTREETLAEIGVFQRMLALGGVGVLYYAGSATLVGGQDYILPIDADYPKVPADMERIAVNVSRLLAPVDKVIEQQSASNGSVTFYAASAGQFAEDGPPGGNSPFTSAVLGMLKEGNVELRQFATQVRQRVEKATGGRQVPSLRTDDLNVDFWFGKPSDDGRIGILKLVFRAGSTISDGRLSGSAA